jgi:hypothetical protein
MDVQTTTPEAPPRSAYEDDERGDGWVGFAGVLLLIVGTLNTIYGIAAIDSANFFVNGDRYIFGDLNTWGWIIVGIGVAQLLVGLGVFARNQFARWTGVFALSCTAVAQLLAIQAYPAWSLTIFVLDVLAIYGLVAYGSRLERA